MIDYDTIIFRWQNSVAKYCAQHGISNMELRNLHKGQILDYELYVAYKNVENAIAGYRKVPSSPVYINDLITSIKKWYILIANNKLRKMSMHVMPNNVFAYFAQNMK